MLFKHCNLSIVPREEKDGLITGVTLKFSESSQDEIYRNSSNEVVQLPPELFQEGINISFNSLIELSASLLDSVSTYLYQFRHELNSGENTIFIQPETEKDVRGLKIYTTRFFFRDKEKSQQGRYKVKISSMNYADKENPYEEVVFPFTKRDVIQLLGVIRMTINQFTKTKSLFLPADLYDVSTGEKLGEAKLPIGRRNNSFNIGTTFLHGQEILNLIYVIDKLAFTMNIEEHLSGLFMNFRQMVCTTDPKSSILHFNLNRDDNVRLNSLPDVINAESDEHILELEKKENKNKEETNVFYLVLTKYNYNNIPEFVEYNGKKVAYVIPFSSKFLTIAYLCLTIDSLRLRFEDDDSSEEDGKRIFGKNAEYANIKYFLSLRESTLGIGVKKYKRKKDKEIFPKITLVGKVNSGVYKTLIGGKERENIIVRTKENGEKEYVNVLSDFSISLESAQWLKLVKALSISYTRAFEKAGNTHNLVKFFAQNISENGVIEKYYFTISSSVYNEAPCVLEIEKFTYDRRTKQETFIAAYRQPLYERYIFQFLTILLSCSEFLDNNLYVKNVNSKDLMYFKYKSMKNVNFNAESIMQYGLKKENGNILNANKSAVYWGDFKTNGRAGIYQTELNEQDQFLLNQSALFKLVRGYWQPFVGDNIAIGPDGYITDTYGEIDTTKPTMEGEKYPDFDWALNLYFGTSYPSFSAIEA